MRFLIFSLCFAALGFSATVPVTVTFNLPSAAYLTDVEQSRFTQVNAAGTEGNLAAAITSGATTITLTGNCPANGVAVYINAEPMLVTAGAGTTTCTVTRNSALSQANTVAAAHNSGAAVAELKYATAQAYFVQVGVAAFIVQCVSGLGPNSAVVASALSNISSAQAAYNALFSGVAQ
jgi:hypothetical protein